MVTTGIINKFIAIMIQNCDEAFMLDTIGDRILYLLRHHGRAERNREYTQSELLAMLNGDTDAPNGKRYDIKTNRSSLSRIISGEQKPSLDILDAICDIFDVDLEWLGRGKTIEEPTIIEAFVSDEANRIGAMIDKLPEDERKMLEDSIRAVYEMKQEIRTQAEQLNDREEQIKELQIEVAILRRESARIHREKAQDIQQSLTNNVDCTSHE